MKKLFTLFLLAFLPLLASADPVEIDGLYYNLISKDKAAVVTSNPSGTKYSDEVVIPNTVTCEGDIYDVTIIGEKAFYFCSNLTSVSIPNSVLIIEDEAFEGCSELSSVPIPNSVKSIGGSAFEGCSSLTSVTIPNSVTSISGGAFYGCSGMTSLTIPNSVLSIATYAFGGCKNLKTIISEIDSPFDINSNVFDSETYLLVDLIVPQGTKSAYQSKTGWSNFLKITEKGSIGQRILIDGIYYVIGDDNSVYVTEGSTAYKGGIEIPSQVTYNSMTYTVTSIGAEAFAWCSSLTSVIIPNSVTVISSGAFSGCSGLKSITIPNSVTVIWNEAFSECGGLTTITIPNSVVKIGFAAFYGCNNLKDVYCYAEELPETEIGVFGESSVNNATLHVPVESIEAYKATEPWNEFKEIVAIEDEEVTTEDVIKITSAKQTTWCSAYDLDFSNVEGLKAYTATGYHRTKGTIWLTRVKEVPAGEGILLIGDEGEYKVPHKSTTAYYANLMVGTVKAITINETDGEYTNYYLSNGDSGVGFYKVNGSVDIKANRAYLPLLKNTVSGTRGFIGMDFDDDDDGTTGISEAQQRVGEQDVYYNLQGQRVNNPGKGLYIRNGKMVVIK